MYDSCCFLQHRYLRQLSAVFYYMLHAQYLALIILNQCYKQFRYPLQVSLPEGDLSCQVGSD